jgi:hypothetical protein
MARSLINAVNVNHPETVDGEVGTISGAATRRGR